MSRNDLPLQPIYIIKFGIQIENLLAVPNTRVAQLYCIIHELIWTRFDSSFSYQALIEIETKMFLANFFTTD